MDVGKIIKKMVIDGGYKNQKALSVGIGISESFISKWKRENHIPSEYLGKFNLPSTESDDLIPVHHRQNINGAGGYGAINEDESAEIIMVSEQMLRAMFGLSTFENLDIINVTGNSMKPIVEDGDTIMVRRTNEVKNNHIAIVRVADQLYIKYFQRHPLGRWIKLSSEDKESYPDMDFEGEEVNEVHVIGELIGKFKPY